MHHHHTASNTSAANAQQRRRKKRPNYGTRTVEVRRGYNGFGFTISGQQPCRLSCIIANSAADQAGLRAGDFLISVNGLNISKMPHEKVVQLIGNSFGSIRMQIAENYYSDSSDEENAALMLQQQDAAVGGAGVNCVGGIATAGQLNLNLNGARAKPRFLHHKTKMHRMRNSPQKKRLAQQQQQQEQLQYTKSSLLLNYSPNSGPKVSDLQTLRPLLEDLPLTLQQKVPVARANYANKFNISNVNNVSAMVRVPTAALEYRAIVGYLGTIEMPKQISHSSKLQTVRSCIRKLRQEKRQPTTVLMTILPDCLRLQAANGSVLASYASERLNYVSSSSESENRFFGLVTSAVHTTPADEDEDIDEINGKATGGHISISNSCHVFVIDTKLIEHQIHLSRATEFRIDCTRDLISNLCLEFPNNSEYVVNLIRSMYTMRILPAATRNLNEDCTNAGRQGAAVVAAAHSPQPSNHSEISTTTSNSDSGIGFHNDCNNISDRILVVDFPNFQDRQLRQPVIRPVGIFNKVDTVNDKRLNVRAMVDPRTPSAIARHIRPDLLANFNLIKSPASSLTATRSCDDVLTLVERTTGDHLQQQREISMPHASMDDISMHTTMTSTDDIEFLHPSCLNDLTNQLRNSSKYQNNNSAIYTLLQDCRTVEQKLSPQVFGKTTAKNIMRKSSATRTEKLATMGTFKEIVGAHNNNDTLPTLLFNYDIDTWSSLQDLHATIKAEIKKTTQELETTNSEPDLGNHGNLPANASPFRRAWGQSSFRTPRTDKHAHDHCQQQNLLVRRTASMTASDNDVYVKSMDPCFIDELKQTCSQQQLNAKLIKPTQQQLKSALTPKTVTAAKSNNLQSSVAAIGKVVPQIKTVAAAGNSANDATEHSGPHGVVAWGTSFERLLEDPAGLHTFAEFLKKEFSAENIYFWTACERFRHLDDATERALQAKAIFSKHLANGSLEPVNVDSQARNLTEEKLQSAERDIFAHAQKQIFNLMKFDSYQRFIRSDLYKSCLEAEEKHQPLPYSAEDLDELLKTNFHQTASSSKLKKSASNAEDRRRKSLLPWHRKTRSKSRDRIDGDNGKFSTPHAPSKLPQLSGSSLKIPSTHNSVSDIHSSRSSLSSFDAFPGVLTHPTNGQAADAPTTTLCRVILSDGATTIVQTRPGETVGQLVERLLEKRGLIYKFYDVVAAGTTKSIDLQSPSEVIAGKEVLIEERVAFKLDLPDPKVISVKSKPKKQLHEVIRPILQKYNYDMAAVEVLMRDTHALVDLLQPVTAVDGQRLQIVLKSAIQNGAGYEYQNGCSTKFARPVLPKNSSLSSVTLKPTGILTPLRNGSSSGGAGVIQQSTLDEITNKVFNELLQGKVEAHSSNKPLTKANDLCSLKSDDCASETSSIFERMRKSTSNIPGFKLRTKKKSISSQYSDDANQSKITATSAATAHAPMLTATNLDVKKPIIAKLKAGVKLQVTERVAENQDELLEGLKRAQLARLEDQRGTEINFELPDFLKNKENLSAAASKLRKLRANLSPISKTPMTPTVEEPTTPTSPQIERPQPAPRHSITSKNKTTTTTPTPIGNLSASVSPMKIDDESSTSSSQCLANTSSSSFENDYSGGSKGPPPLPPKPKVLPIKPSNWGANNTPVKSNCNNGLIVTLPSKIPIDISRKTSESSPRCAYLEEPSSSFV